VHYVLGWCNFGLDEPSAAVAAWERVRLSVPTFEPVYFDLADAYHRQKDDGRALAVLAVAGERWPQDPDVHSAMGTLFVSRRTIAEAIAAFERALALRPDDATACYNLAKASEIRYVQMFMRTHSRAFDKVANDRDRAVKYYQRTVRLGGPYAEEAAAALKRLGARR
jgi:tetratricopeptide (TPR) repeat protein